VTYTPSQLGTDTFWYWVSDGEAYSNSAEVHVYVEDAPTSLLVSGPGSSVENTTLFFTATADLVAGGPTDATADSNVVWTVGPPSSPAYFANPGQLTLGDFPSNQTITVTATYTLVGRPSVADTISVSISNITQAPNLVIGASSFGDEGQAVFFSGTINDLDGPPPWTYNFDFGDGDSVFGTTSLSSVSGSHVYLDDGNYPRVFTVADSGAPAATGSDSWNIAILNLSPSVTISAVNSAQVGETVAFTSSVFDWGSLDTHTYLWDFDDGSPASTAANPSHAYAETGTYNVLLSVNDGDQFGTGIDTHVITVSSGAAPAGTVWYVDENSPAGAVGDGTSWNEAFLHPASAMAAAASGDQVWVAAGNYLPTFPDPALPVVSLVYGVKLYGGFVGGETSLDQRDWGTNTTILNGDNGGALPGTGDVYTVVTGVTNAIVDGFWIVNGNATGFSTEDMGKGGGVYAVNVQDMTLRNSIVAWNVANDSGGGMYANSSDSITLETVQFYQNTVLNPVSGLGGGFAADGTTNTTIRYAAFESNYSGGDGGAIGLDNSSLPTWVSYSWFEDNQAGRGGAYAGLAGAGTSFDNTLFIRNQSFSGGGGALYSDFASAGLDVTNSTFSENSTAAGPGGGIYSFATITNYVYNSVLWGDISAGVGDTDREIFGPVSVLYSDVDRGTLATYSGTGNINADPAFADTVNFELTQSSPCVDAGDNLSVISSIDIAGNTRIYDGDGDSTATVDMGAYEWQPVKAGSLFFRGYRPPVIDQNQELMAFDAASGVSILTSVSGGLDPYYLTAYQGKLYFQGQPTGSIADVQLMSFDHDAGALSTHTAWVNDTPRDLTVHDEKLYMIRGGDFQIYSWDGVSLLPVTTVAGLTVPTGNNMATAFGKLYFSGNQGGEGDIWSYDDAAFITTRETFGGHSPGAGTLTPYADNLYFQGLGSISPFFSTLFFFDPVSGVATSLRDPGVSSTPWYLTPFDGKLYFSAVVDTTGVVGNRQLMSYNALDSTFTRLSTQTAFGGLEPRGLTPFNGVLYFKGNDSDGLHQLFSFDDVNGLVQVTFAPADYVDFDLVVHDEKLYFEGLDDSSNQWIWTLDSAGVITVVPGSLDLVMFDPISFNPENPPAADATGTWDFTETIGANNCNDPVGSVYALRSSVVQKGSQAVVQTEHGTVNFTIEGSEFTGTSVYPEGIGTTTEEFTLFLGAGGDTLTGSSIWDWNDGSFFCSGGSSYLGFKD
jgi:PKD repeat protein